MTSFIDRSSARSTKGWIAGDHVGASKLNELLVDAEAQGCLNARVRITRQSQKALLRPISHKNNI